MSRLAWIHANLWPRAVSAAQARRAAGRALEGAVETALAAGAENDAWALFQGYDPTPGHEALPWLLRRWTAGAIRGEDLAKARDSIQVWSKTKQRLPVEARDLGRYKTLAELDRVLIDAGIDFDVVLDGGAVSGKAVKREFADRIREEESIVLLDPPMPGSDGWTIAVPLTMDAARWWGRGTRWCTAAREDEDNAFEEYDKDGPLIVFVAPNGAKWQWHPKTNQLADAADTMVTFEQCPAFGKWPELLTYAVTQNGDILGGIPGALRTESLCLAAVEKNGFALDYVPDALRTEHLCLTAVEQNGWALEYVPEALRTASLCLAAVQQYGRALGYVPEHLRTETMCLAAVGEDGIALGDVPFHLRTEDICLSAVKREGLALRYVPEHLRTADLRLTAVQQNGSALCHVPEALRTEALCLAAVRQNGLALEYVPNALWTEALCLAAVKQDGKALQYISNALRTESLCLAAVEQTGEALSRVPYALRTEEICLMAVKQDGWALCLVPEASRTEEICLMAVRQKGWALYSVPYALRTESLCLAAVEQSSKALRHVPDALLTESMCLEAVKQDGQTLRHIPEHLRDHPAIKSAYIDHLARWREERLTGPLAGLLSIFDTYVAAATAAASETCLQDFGDRLRRSCLLPTPEAVTP